MGVEGKKKAESPTAGTVEICRDVAAVTVKLIRTTEVSMKLTQNLLDHNG